MRITQKGQVTIPQFIRDRLYVRKKEGESRRGDEVLEHMRGKGSREMSTDEIMRLTREQKKRIGAHGTYGISRKKDS